MKNDSQHNQQNIENDKDQVQKSPAALREEAVLAFWQENNVFEKSLQKKSPKGNYVFYDGPPYATGLPHYGHMVPSTIKDLIPRYKTMQGYHVPRRWGWDCHGLPIENLIEKELGLKSKRDIEQYGIGKFNQAARDSVLTYDTEWKKIVTRVGRWVDMDNNYRTMDPSYTESGWWAFKTLNEKGLVYEDFKAMLICPRCQTTLSNFEVNQGYKDVQDISVYVLFAVADVGGNKTAALTDVESNAAETKTYFLAWTTTPWTLPGNAALAVNPELEYSLVETKHDESDVRFWVASTMVQKLLEKKVIKESFRVLKTASGSELAGTSYTPVFDFYTKEGTLKNPAFSMDQEKNRAGAWKVYTADFVTAEDGTGIVHIAPGFGEDDLKLGQSKNIPIIQHVGFDGIIKEGNGHLSGMHAKAKDEPQKTDVEVIKVLAASGNLFAKEKITHSYPHCWRCDTPLLNYATSSWFIKATALKDQLIAENNKVQWVPREVGEGRFGKWLENVRDWPVSRSRYWGAPLPIWRGEKTGKLEFLGSVKDLKSKIVGSGNSYFLMRHGECESNVKDVINGSPEFLDLYSLTDLGKEQAKKGAGELKRLHAEKGGNVVIYASDFKRTRQTAEAVAEALGVPVDSIHLDARLREVDGGTLEGKTWHDRAAFFKDINERIFKPCPHGESVFDVKARTAAALYDIEQKHKGSFVVVVTHGLPLRMMLDTAEGKTARDFLRSGWTEISDPTASVHSCDFKPLPHNESFELDLHKPYIDEVVWRSEDGDTMRRVPEVFDVWYDSGSMPFAQNHYPFENKDLFERDNSSLFPADFIAEGLDQTRGWFYVLLVLSTGLFGKSPYKNVTVNGLILAEDGRKMSKSLKNYPPLVPTIDKFGADALRYFLAASPAVRGEEVLFSEKGLDEVQKKLFNRLENVYQFYEMYAEEFEASYKHTYEHAVKKEAHVLDAWIVSRLAELKGDIEKGLDAYAVDKAARPIADFIDDLSTWYIRRSRDRYKGDDMEDKQAAIHTTRFVLITFSMLIAPFVPFIAEDLYRKVKPTLTHPHHEGKDHATALSPEHMPMSVHLADWPHLPDADNELLSMMNEVRQLVESGLALRAKAGIKVRQPLASFTYPKPSVTLSQSLKDIVAEELNVKEVKEGASLELDTEVTGDLKEEGMMRDVIRAVQDLRKKNGLTPGDRIVMTVDLKGDTSIQTRLQQIFIRYMDFLKKPILAEEIGFGEVTEGEEVTFQQEEGSARIFISKI